MATHDLESVPFDWRGDREAEGRQILDRGMRPGPGWSGGRGDEERGCKDRARTIGGRWQETFP